MATRFEATNGTLKVRAYASSYVIWLVWDYTGDRSDLLGFALSRSVNGGAASWLKGMRRFKSEKAVDPKEEKKDDNKEKEKDPVSENIPLNMAPVQAFSWADYEAKPGQTTRYRLVAMHGTPSALVERSSVDLEVHNLVPGKAHHEVFFNRGAAGSQAYARRYGNRPPSEVPDRAAYVWLSRGLEEGLMTFLAQAVDKHWALRVAAYELDYVPFLAALKAAIDRGVDVKLVHDCKPGKDKEHVGRADAAIEKAGMPRELCLRRTSDASVISHNKFIVAIKDGKPIELWTGSCNFTEGGIFGQANAGHWVHNDEALASSYLAYWSRLAADPSAKELRVANETATPLPSVLHPRSTTVLFSPRSSGDALRMYTDLFRRAQHSLCFTAAFGINKEFADVLVEGGTHVVRYVALEKRGKGQADIEKHPFNRVAVGAVLEADEHAPWESEKLSGLNQHVEYIHTKVLLIDPFSDDPTVVVGSGNFSTASVEKNDENMLVVRGDTQLSDQYLVEFMRIWNHFHFRNEVATAKKHGDASTPVWLIPDASWSVPFFAANTLAARERLLFIGAVDATTVGAQHKDLVVSLAPTVTTLPVKEKELGKVEESGTDGWLAVSFPYNKDVVEALKTTLSGSQRRWDGEGKRWLVSTSAGATLTQIAKANHWAITPAAAALLANPPKPIATSEASPRGGAAPTPSTTPSVALVPAVTSSSTAAAITAAPVSAEVHALMAVSPVDGRYRRYVKQLSDYFSEFALIKYRVKIEVEYLIALGALGLSQLKGFGSTEHNHALRALVTNFTEADASKIKATELVTNHDVKAVEYFVKEKLESLKLGQYSEFVHFGLTSQALSSFRSMSNPDLYLPSLKTDILQPLVAMAEQWKDVPMLAHTHGQPASPTRVGKELGVFVERVRRQLRLLEAVPFSAKLGGATGNFNAHHVAYPHVNWPEFADKFVASLGLERQQYTTQVEHYDDLAALLDATKRINVILVDLCRDVWTYVSLEYFKQKISEKEVGSSAMPHKVNPIDFENAEGNLGLANSLFEHMALKLPISRLQRDLTDSTVLRNLGVPFSHTMVAYKSICKGLAKLLLNQECIDKDLAGNYEVVSEALQTILRREGFPKPYEALKALTRTNERTTKESLSKFIDGLQVSAAVKEELKAITPWSFVGVLPAKKP